jgi:hypothetical protein
MANKKVKNGFITMKCSICSAKVERVDAGAKSVICWQCTHLGTEGYTESEIQELTITGRKRIFVK